MIDTVFALKIDTIRIASNGSDNEPIKYILGIAFSFATIIVAFAQLKIARDKNKHEKFDKRMEVFQAYEKYFTQIFAKFNPTEADTKGYLSGIAQARFLFGTEVTARLNQLFENGFKLRTLNEAIATGRSSPNNPTEAAQFQLYVEERRKITDWLINIQEKERIETIFLPYMDFRK